MSVNLLKVKLENPLSIVTRFHITKKTNTIRNGALSHVSLNGNCGNK